MSPDPRLALARPHGPRPGHRPIPAHDDGRLLRLGHGPEAGHVRALRPKLPPAPLLPGLRGAGAGDRRPARTSPSLAEQVEGLRHFPAFAGIDPEFFARLARSASRATSGRSPKGRSSSRVRPLLRVTAPLPQAQWVETFLLTSLVYPTLVASKAARVVDCRRGTALYDFGARRGHGPHAGLLAARAAYIAGFEEPATPRRRGAGHPCLGNHGPLLGPVVRLRSRGIRRLRQGLSRMHDPPGRHVRHARRRAQGGGDRAPCPGRSGSTAATWMPSPEPPEDPRRARPRSRQDRGLGRSRRVPDRCTGRRRAPSTASASAPS